MRTQKDVNVQLYVGFYDAEEKFIFHEQVKMQQLLACITELEVVYVNKSFINTNYIVDKLDIC